MTVATTPFALFGDLPRGTTVLEASAGTGKTFTIAALVTRNVAEGVATLDQLLVVTFSRLATQELRDRVRARLVSARDGLAHPVAARDQDADALLRHLADADDAEVARRRERLADALGGFDAATIVTIHGFAEQVLVGLGTAGDFDTGAVFVDDFRDLVNEVVDDLYVRKWACGPASDAAPALSPAQARELARTVVEDGASVLAPDDPAPGSDAELRLRFARRVREEVERRKRLRRMIGFDDQLTRLRDALADAQTGDAAAARLQQRYRIVLVDEFQDTDAVQWEIVHRAFSGAATVVLIGDPKQAIYAFRGADIASYLDAAGTAGTHETLPVNWRSDADLLRGLEQIFRGAQLGDPRIVVHPVQAEFQGRSLAVDRAPVTLRVLPGGENGPPAVGEARAAVATDVAREIVTLLRGQALLTPRSDGPARPVAPGDIAVIVDDTKQSQAIATALASVGVPSVQKSFASVFGTPAAREWLVLLEALEQPRTGRVRRLAISAMVGWTAEQLTDDAADRLAERLRSWLRLLETRGVAALFEAVNRDENLPGRLLTQPDGERLLTDLRHVGEALHVAAMHGQLGLSATLEWLRRRIDDATRGDQSVERSRRLDSDAAAVQVMTVWASKGLEFPVVLVPFGWHRFPRTEDIPLFHDARGRRARDVGGSSSPTLADARAACEREELGEDLRQLYVALTRAQSQLIAWWAPSKRSTECGPLHRLLFADDPARDIPRSVPVPGHFAVMQRLRSLALPGCLSVEEVPDEPDPSAAGAVRWQPGAAPAPDLAAAVFARELDTGWRRTSYTRLTFAAHEAAPVVGSEPEVDETDDELPTDVTEVTGDDALRAVLSPMNELPSGASFGTLVHAVLEEFDPAAGDIAEVLRSSATELIARMGPVGLQADALAAGLTPALRTPLGPLANGRALAHISRSDRLSELEFELPLRGGDRPNGTSRLADVADLLRTTLPPSDPLAGYPQRLADPAIADAVLKGYLTGSIDAVLRVDGRFVIVDYKTNRLGSSDTPLAAWDYRQDAMAQAMVQAHYPLQALLYSVALHRYLRWRLPDYSPDVHLGGVLYLFLRGMCGPQVVAADGSIPGVFAWQPPASVITGLSDLLAKGRR